MKTIDVKVSLNGICSHTIMEFDGPEYALQDEIHKLVIDFAETEVQKTNKHGAFDMGYLMARAMEDIEYSYTVVKEG